MVKGKMKPLQEVIYLQDILSQPDSLGNALAGFDRGPLIPLAEALRQGSLDRILLTGMGASFDAAYPAWLALVQAGLPAIWVDSAELIHHAGALVTRAPCCGFSPSPAAAPRWFPPWISTASIDRGRCLRP